MTTVAVVGTGGTISNAGTAPLDYLSYMDVGTVLSLEDVLARFPLIHEVATIHPVPFATLRSRAIGLVEWIELRATVSELVAREDIDGVVITHGTASLEETAYFLHLTVRTDKPVVIVGAQRPATSVGSDAYANLVAAIRVAASPTAVSHGCLVVMNDAIHSAREVAKTSNHRLETMRSPELGPLGWVDPDGLVAMYRRSLRRHTIGSDFSAPEQWSGGGRLPRVDIAYGYAGADGAEVDAFVARGAGGIVVAGMPPAVNPPQQEERLQVAFDAGVAIVQSSRAGGGRAIARATRALLSEACAADNLNAQSARVLLLVALHAGVARDDLQAIFDTH